MQLGSMLMTIQQVRRWHGSHWVYLVVQGACSQYSQYRILTQSLVTIIYNITLCMSNARYNFHQYLDNIADVQQSKCGRDFNQGQEARTCLFRWRNCLCCEFIMTLVTMEDFWYLIYFPEALIHIGSMFRLCWFSIWETCFINIWYLQSVRSEDDDEFVVLQKPIGDIRRAFGEMRDRWKSAAWQNHHLYQ